MDMQYGETFSFFFAVKRSKGQYVTVMIFGKSECKIRKDNGPAINIATRNQYCYQYFFILYHICITIL